MFLSLLLPSCIVAPIRELVNILFSTTSTVIQTSQIAQLPSTIDMNIDTDIVRGRSTFSNLNSSRKLSILSKMLSIAYHEWMEVINNLLSNDIRNPINSLQLSYTSKNVNAEKGKLVSKMTDNSFQKKTLHFISKTSAYPVYEIRILLIWALIHVLHRESLTFRYHMTLIKQLNKILEIETSIPFLFMICLSTFCQIWIISRSYCTA